MSDEYEKIENFGSEIYEWYKGILLKERLLYGEMIELLLESFHSHLCFFPGDIYYNCS